MTAVTATDLRRLGIELLTAVGTSPPDAATVIDHLLDADRRGLRSHGALRIPQYLAEVASGTIDPSGLVRVTRTSAGRATVDGGRAFGQVVGRQMTELAVELAQAVGVAVVVGRNMGHTGRIGAYPEAIAEAGMLGFAVSSGPPQGHWVAPFGGRDGKLATNPIAYAFPADGTGPVVADFSTSVVPEGMIRSLFQRGLPAPTGALRDSDGMPTTDPGVLYREPKGAIQPLGGDAGYRGTALAVLAEVLAGTLAGDRVDDTSRPGSNLMVLALALPDGFPDLASAIGSHLRSAVPIDPARPVMMPGDRELAALRGSGTTVELDDVTWQALREYAARHGCRALEAAPGAA